MKFLKLTYAGKNAPTLVNMDFVKSMYVVHDAKGVYEPSTKILFKDESYINVSEDLQSILKMTQDFQEGKFQETDWETPVASPQQRFEGAYNTRNRFRVEKNYNSAKTFNDNLW